MTEPQINLAALKAGVKLIKLIPTRLELRKTGTQILGVCPFHEDKTPSLVINSEKNLWYCHGCQEGGSIIDWVMKTENVSIGEAIRRLAKRYPQYAEPENNKISIKEKTKPTPLPKPEVSKLPQPQETIKQALGHYNHTLNSNEFAKQYLLNRGVTKKSYRRIQHRLL